jgi:putative phosphoesterase
MDDVDIRACELSLQGCCRARSRAEPRPCGFPPAGPDGVIIDELVDWFRARYEATRSGIAAAVKSMNAQIEDSRGTFISRGNGDHVGDETPPTGGATPMGGTLREASESGQSATEKQPEAARRSGVRIGVIADAHGYLDGSVTRVFAGVDHIIVAGDALDPEILTALGEIAPVTAVTGPSDGEPLASTLPREAHGDVGGVRFAVGHSSKRLLKRLSSGGLSIGPEGSMPDLVVSAGTHEPSVVWIQGSLFLDPGTAGSPDREDNDPTVAIVERQGTAGLTARFYPLRRRRGQRQVTRKVLGFRWGFLPTLMDREVGTPRRRRGVR